MISKQENGKRVPLSPEEEQEYKRDAERAQKKRALRKKLEEELPAALHRMIDAMQLDEQDRALLKLFFEREAQECGRGLYGSPEADRKLAELFEEVEPE